MPAFESIRDRGAENSENNQQVRETRRDILSNAVNVHF